MKMDTMSKSQLMRMYDAGVVSAAGVGNVASLSAPGALGLCVQLRHSSHSAFYSECTKLNHYHAHTVQGARMFALFAALF
jgi:hypothetical protein